MDKPFTPEKSFTYHTCRLGSSLWRIKKTPNGLHTMHLLDRSISIQLRTTGNCNYFSSAIVGGFIVIPVYIHDLEASGFEVNL